VLPGCQWHTWREGEEPLSWFPVPYIVSRHTWSMRPYQRVSTFVSGASSVSVVRSLAAHGFGSPPPGLRGIIQRELPSLTITYKEASKAGKVKKNFRIHEGTFNVLLTSKLTEWHASNTHFDLAGHIHEGPNGET
jgi:hypothetical protein